jgi:hypothetical protein
MGRPEDIAAQMASDPGVQLLLREHAARVLEHLANEAHAVGAGGTEPALNLMLGRMLRNQAALLRVRAEEADRPQLPEPAPADTAWEYGFQGPMTGLMYVTTNDMLAETMHASRPSTPLFRRPVTDWTHVTGIDG